MWTAMYLSASVAAHQPGAAAMSLAAPPPQKPLTAEQLAAMPDDGVERELIRGELREKPTTRRTPSHGETVAQIAYHLYQWLDKQPKPRGRITAGEAGFRLSRNPDTFVGIDVAYAPAEMVAAPSPKRAFYEGAPVLAVEVLSPSDNVEDIAEKVEIYLEAGSAVWVVNPYFRTVSVHRPGQPPQALDVNQELSCDPELPGFRVPVREIFEF
jgi:Uma2 family endonuclease